VGRRLHHAERCPRCRLHTAVCMCDRIPTLSVATALVVVMHLREVNKPTASAPLAMAALPNHVWLIHGVQDKPVDLREHVPPDRRGLLLFPSDGARVLDAALLAEDPRPVTLVVPDGSWRQASKAARRLPGADTLEPVVLAAGPPTRYRLRREPMPGGLATMEAIARAFGVLEGPDVRHALEALFDEMVERTLEMRQATGPVGGPDRVRQQPTPADAIDE
jgi:DTW domain-containing protein YfiP